MSKQLLLENISKEELIDHLRQLYSYMKSKLPKIDRDPKLFLREDEQNANDILGKTGYYDPETDEICLYITDRHAKDILRSFAHELIHHEQNCSGMTAKLDMTQTNQIDYASKNKGLRMAERDAFRRGNMLFRDWTDSLKVGREKGKNVMSEKKNKKRKHKKRKHIGKNDIEDAEKSAREAARTYLKHRSGRDLKEMPKELEESENANNKLEETANNPYPELFEPKERVLQDAFQKREEIVFQELIKRFSKQ